jgi:hypothetical protein
MYVVIFHNSWTESASGLIRISEVDYTDFFVWFSSAPLKLCWTNYDRRTGYGRFLLSAFGSIPSIRKCR